MANKKKKYNQNINGKFYVDTDCIACAACTGIATDFFSMNDDEGHAYVSKQPETSDDIALCEEALGACPVEAIGDDCC